ncbi:UvrD-helicase domain-containing protein [Patescibacteria group bacterium]|nr:UvrD-helicase domain-containing protein [Patescibacteria group bacterium]
MEYLKELNQAQQSAVTKTEGPLLVLAGAGSGKTRVITYRILHLIDKGVLPHNILAVTFTNKAAREMRERVIKLIKTNPALGRILPDTSPTVSTFHSLGVMLLREQHQVLGLKKHFTIYDRADSLTAVKQGLEALGYGTKQFEPRKILSHISKAKGDAQTAQDYGEKASSYIERVVKDVWARYETILRENEALDFDDLLLRTLTMLRNHEHVRIHYQERFRYIHVDEYQDTNKVQYEIMRLLAGEAAHLCAVGDVDQNIYSWRGADMHNILQFERHFKGAEVVLLEENYRSTQTIIAASNDVIEKNKERIPKTVFTKNAEGEPLSLYAAFNETEEASYIARTARDLIRDGADPSGIAVLYRANFQSRVLEDAFLEYNVQYQMLGTRFFERREVKDVLSYVRLALNPQSTNDLARIINVPARGIGKVTVLKLLEGKTDTISGKTRAQVSAFYEMMDTIRAELSTKPLSTALKYIIRASGLEGELKTGGEAELERLENIGELVSLATRYDEYTELTGAEKLLEDAALQSDQDALDEKDQNKEGVKLMTVHAAKGLEFPYVFIAGLEEGLFPHERMGDEKTDDEEERRLFYVALTRAEKKVFLSFAGIRTVYGSQRINAPSSFISDISEAHIVSANPKESGYERTVYLD